MPDVLINGYGYGYNKLGMKMYEQREHDSNLGDVFKYDAVHRLTGVKYNSPESSNPDTTQFEKAWEAHYDQVDNILRKPGPKPGPVRYFVTLFMVK